MLFTLFSIRFGSVPLNEANKRRCSSAVSISKRTSCYGQTPSIVLIVSISLKISCPNTSALPDVGCNRPVNIERVVVFPAPLCPNKAKI